jgi:hypothetical protein
MAATTTNNALVGVAQGEQAEVAKVARLLEAQSSAPVILTAADGQAVVLPEAAMRVLRAAMRLLASGQPVTVLPAEEGVTRAEAANFLNVRPEYIDRLLESGELSTMTSKREQQIRIGDLLAYRQRRRERERAGLRELTRMSEELGMYDPDFPVPGEE